MMKPNVKSLLSAIFVGFVALWTLGCGGAQAGARGASQGGDDDGAGPSDPKVAEAKERCDEEIRRSEIQPPDQLKSIQIRACMYAAKQEVAKCHTVGKRELILRIVVDKSGQVTNAFAVGDTADCPEAQCVADVVMGIRLPRFKGRQQQIIKYPFTLGE